MLVVVNDWAPVEPNNWLVMLTGRDVVSEPPVSVGPLIPLSFPSMANVPPPVCLIVALRAISSPQGEQLPHSKLPSTAIVCATGAVRPPESSSDRSSSVELSLVELSVRVAPVIVSDPPPPWTEPAVCDPADTTTVMPSRQAISDGFGTAWVDGSEALVQLEAVCHRPMLRPVKSSVQVAAAPVVGCSAASAAAVARMTAATASSRCSRPRPVIRSSPR